MTAGPLAGPGWSLVVALVIASTVGLELPALAGQSLPVGSGAIGVRLLDAPATAQADPRARLYIVDHVAPGTTIRRRVQVTNTTSSTGHVALYAAAARIQDAAFVG